MTTKNIAAVKVTNHTSAHVLAVTVGHKYSDVYKNMQTFRDIPDGKSTTESLTVEFNTGIFTTGCDWWIINWIQERQEGGKKIIESCVIDTTNSSARLPYPDEWFKNRPNELKYAVSTDSIASGRGDLIGIAAGTTTHLIEKMMNDDSIVGYAQHILREEDVKEGLEILLTNNGRVLFKSRSRESETKYAKSVLNTD